MSRFTNIVHLLRYLIKSPRETGSLLNSLVSVMRAAQLSPRETASLLNLLVSVTQGERFSREAMFAPHRQHGDEGQEGTNPILSYFNAHREGPGIFRWMHYFDIYHRHFSKFVGRDVHVLEVGIYSGGSLPMWRDYFGKGCHVYGVDINEGCMAYEDVGIKVFIGDQADRSFWAHVKHEVPTIDILIDDGGHVSAQQRITLEEMLPYLAAGGVYVCEDIHGVFNHFAAYLQGLASSLNSGSPSEISEETHWLACPPSNFQAAINSIHLYPFAAVIEKRERSLDQMVCAKHGTQWLW